MSLSTYVSLMTEIRSGKFKPLYFLEGDETYFIDKVADSLERHVLTEAEKAFNFQIIYAKDAQLIDVISAARRFPMMANHQLILVREAQHYKSLDDLLAYLSNLVPSTILVFLYKGKKVNKATKLGKELKKYGLLTTKALYDSEMMTWLQGHIKAMGLTIEPKAAELLIRSSGNNLHKVSNELEKIHANMGSRIQISLDDIAKHTGLDKEYNVFELTRFLGEKNRFKCLQIVKYFHSNPKDNPFVLVLSTIFNYFKKVHLVHYAKTREKGELAKTLGLNPYFVGEYISAANHFPPYDMSRVFALCHEFDLRSKGMQGGQSQENELLTELIVRIIK